MNTLLLLVTIICVGYVLFSTIDGIPESLSATYYRMNSKGWLFQLTLFLIGLLLIPVWMGLSKDGTEFLPFLGCGSLWMVASAPLFKASLERQVHYAFAVICGGSALLWQVLHGVWDVTLFFGAAVAMLVIANYKKYMWWVELGLMGSLLVNLWRLM